MNRRTPPLVETAPLRGLTRRQLQIVQILKTGASNKEIAHPTWRPTYRARVHGRYSGQATDDHARQAADSGGI